MRMLIPPSFIDMTSHELRNPLSAVVQCAESVITSLQRLPVQPSIATPAESESESESSSIREEIDSSLDALQTIVSCSLHQKRVIDDVLTLSKLDSNLIVITPVRVQPTVVVSEAMKMFLVECKQMDIELKLIEDDSIKQFEWVMLDPSRLLQVLINLLYAKFLASLLSLLTEISQDKRHQIHQRSKAAEDYSKSWRLIVASATCLALDLIHRWTPARL
jgi:signal transduction histidine kinase